jgi:thiol-disulfide isomerase/thioredoxin
MRQVRHVGADDLMSRKIESWTTFTGDWGEEAPAPRSFVGTYTNVKTNSKPADSTFQLAAKTGYTTAEPDAAELGIESKERPKLKFAVGDTAPAFTLASRDGKDVTLADLKGRVVLLDFWATWCGPCKMAMPGVQKLSEKYKDQAVSVFGVDTFEGGAPAKAAEKARKYMDSKKYTYGLLFAGDKLAKTYGISGIPTFVLIDKDGKIIHIGVGFDEDGEDKLAEKIDKALNSKS